MQLLVCTGYEQKKTSGFGFIKGEVRPIIPKIDEMKIHIGWNNVNFKHSSSLFKNIEQDSDFYFVHCYGAFDVPHDFTSYSYCNYDAKIISSANVNHIMGVQFHPEKSQTNGLILLDNFLSFSNV